MEIDVRKGDRHGAWKPANAVSSGDFGKITQQVGKRARARTAQDSGPVLPS